MAGEGVQGSCDTQDTRASDEDAEEGEGDTEDFVTSASEELSAYIVETVDI
jgi:hypothetical protein